MRVKLYPAIFSSDGNNGYTVTFPDLIGCVTEGDTLEEAVKWLKMHWVSIYIR